MTDQLDNLKAAWTTRWPEALGLWSKFTKLREPRWCFDEKEEQAEGLTSSFAMIRLNDTSVVVSLAQILAQKLENYPLEILGHEIGHHVYCPADLSDQGRMIARMRRALPTREYHAALVANLYADLLINDRLQRHVSLRMADVYKALGSDSTDRMWTFYMRIYGDCNAAASLRARKIPRLSLTPNSARDSFACMPKTGCAAQASLPRSV